MPQSSSLPLLVRSVCLFVCLVYGLRKPQKRRLTREGTCATRGARPLSCAGYQPLPWQLGKLAGCQPGEFCPSGLSRAAEWRTRRSIAQQPARCAMCAVAGKAWKFRSDTDPPTEGFVGQLTAEIYLHFWGLVAIPFCSQTRQALLAVELTCPTMRFW